MSHIATVQTRVKDVDVLKDIIKDLGFEMIEGEGSVSAMDGGKKKVVAKIKNREFGIEAVKDAEGETTYKLVGEFYGTQWYNKEKELSDKINRQYAAKKTKKELAALGYFVAENTELKENADGSIEFVMSKY